MTVRSRFIKSVVAAAKADNTQMPWARGEARRQMIERRSELKDWPENKKTASA